MHVGLNDPEGCCVHHFVVWSRSQNTVNGPLISSTWETHTRAHRHTYTHTYTQSESGSARFSEACLIFPVYPLSRVLLSHCLARTEAQASGGRGVNIRLWGGVGITPLLSQVRSASRARALCGDPFQST